MAFYASNSLVCTRKELEYEEFIKTVSIAIRHSRFTLCATLGITLYISELNSVEAGFRQTRHCTMSPIFMLHKTPQNARALPLR